MDGPPMVNTDDSVDDAAKCQICCSNLLAPQPIVLSCGHSVCEECVPSLINMEDITMEKCPFCQKHVNLGDGRRCIEYERLYTMAKKVENRGRMDSEKIVELQEQIKDFKRKLQLQAAMYRTGKMQTGSAESAAADLEDNSTEASMAQSHEREEILRKEIFSLRERDRCENEAAMRFDALEREMEERELTCRANYEKQLKAVLPGAV